MKSYSWVMTTFWSGWGNISNWDNSLDRLTRDLELGQPSWVAKVKFFLNCDNPLVWLKWNSWTGTTLWTGWGDTYLELGQRPRLAEERSWRGITLWLGWGKIRLNLRQLSGLVEERCWTEITIWTGWDGILLKGTVSPDITFYFRFCKIKSVHTFCKTAYGF